MPGETGLLVEARDEEALADALGRLLDDEDARGAMGERARDHVLATASSEGCLDAIDAFLTSVVTAHAEAAR